MSGWTVWGGGECPVDLDATVAIENRADDKFTAPAAHVFWTHIRKQVCAYGPNLDNIEDRVCDGLTDTIRYRVLV